MGPGMTIDLAASLAIGFLGSLHCLGMCGPLILAYSLHIGGAQMSPSGRTVAPFQGSILHHLAFHLGRLLVYGFLGALAGLLCELAALDRLLFNLRSGMTLLGGAVMTFLGFALLRLIPLPRLTNFSFGAAGKDALGRLLRSQSVSTKMVLGMAVGFLPCGLSWAMIVKAATTHNVYAGFLIMAAFGLGTVPALLLPGISASFVSLRLRLMGERIAALSVIVMGLFLVYKGAKIFV
jgi:sulfite exporter TauE/SafE